MFHRRVVPPVDFKYLIHMIKYLFIPLLLILLGNSAEAQLRLPQASPKATVSQTIGLTDITVSYHTPGVRGRQVWGKLVPYGQVWRSGANESTLITFSDDVKINGTALPAGTYSFFTLPESETNWFVIFNRNTKLWGSEGYNPAEDIIRVPVKPEAVPFHETLHYYFSDVEATEGKLNLVWEKLKIPFMISVEVFDKAVATLKADLAQVKEDDWNSYAQAAQFLIQNNKQHELALQWINKSIKIKENFYNNWLKAQLLAQKDEYEEAVNLTKKALKLGPKESKTFSPLAQEMERSLDVWKVKMHSRD
jgi:tetratricopeptide (TPR) repeat protein